MELIHQSIAMADMARQPTVGVYTATEGRLTCFFYIAPACTCVHLTTMGKSDAASVLLKLCRKLSSDWKTGREDFGLLFGNAYATSMGQAQSHVDKEGGRAHCSPLQNQPLQGGGTITTNSTALTAGSNAPGLEMLSDHLC